MLGSCAVCQRTQAPELDAHLRVRTPHGARHRAGGRGDHRQRPSDDGTVFYSVWAPGNAARNGVYTLGRDGNPPAHRRPARRRAPQWAGHRPGRTDPLHRGQLQWHHLVRSGLGRTSVTPWLTDAALAPVPGAALPIGANGLRFHNGAPVGQQLQQGNTAAGTGHRRGRSHPPCRERPAQHRRSQLPDPLLRCGVRGAERLLLGERPGQDRGGLPGRHLQGGSDQRYGLASPSATAVRGNRLYITDGGVPEPHDAKLQTGRINVAALLAGAAH